MRSLLLRVEGKVQGVGYRAFVERRARSLGLAGWVRNRRDGSVEALIAGRADVIDTMLDALRQGPPAAAVSGLVIVREGDAAPSAFAVLPTR